MMKRLFAIKVALGRLNREPSFSELFFSGERRGSAEADQMRRRRELRAVKCHGAELLHF